MRKIIYLFLSLIIFACSDDDVDNNNTLSPEYVGTWEALYSGDDFGDALVIISNTGDVTGVVDELYQVTGTLTNNGVLNAASGSVNDGVNTIWSGVLNTDGTGSGTWSNSGFSGEWVAVKN